MSEVTSTWDYDWLNELPKLELHIHLEGSIPLSTIQALSQRHGERMPASAQELFKAPTLHDFLQRLDWVCALIRDEASAAMVVENFADYCHQQGIVYAEVIVNPTHWSRLPMRTLLKLLADLFEETGTNSDLQLYLLPSILRDQSAEHAEELAQFCAELQHPRIAGLSTDGDEQRAGRTAPRFARAYAIAGEAGLGLTAHAGESSGPEGVQDALDLLKVDRIDHGVRAIEDPSLTDRLAAEQIPLNVCVSSNCRRMYPSITAHPIGSLLKAGVTCTINTDDPVVLENTLCTELALIGDHFEWDQPTLIQSQKSAIQAAFCNASEKQKLLARLDQFAADTAVR